MDPAFDNFLFIPDPLRSPAGRLYVLEKRTGYAPETFVIIPYNEPGEQLQPVYYSIKELRNVSSLDATSPSGILTLRAILNRETYLKKIRALKKEIGLGNIYEINFCTQFICESAKIDPVSVFYALNKIAKAPYAALLKLGDEFIISASPELFLKKEGLLLSSKPIKGTIRRGKDELEDAALKDALYHSLKERTENVMAVDVARNDLSRLATRGTVKVNRLYHIETFETVHQMVSTVSCELKNDTAFEEIINCTFPMASMTGAPKTAAMEFIKETEGFKRGPYSGAMGLIGHNGDFTLSVNIRSIFYNRKSGRLWLAAGGAITHLSEPEKEYDECLLKASALLKALNAKIA